MNQLVVFTLTLLAVAVLAQDSIESSRNREEQFLRLVRLKACREGRCDDNRIDGTGGESSSSQNVPSLDSMYKESSDYNPMQDETRTREFPVRNKRKCMSWICRRSEVDTVRSADRQDGNTEEDNSMIAGTRKRAATPKQRKKKRCLAWKCNAGKRFFTRDASIVNQDEIEKKIQKRIPNIAEKIARGVLTAKKGRRGCMSWGCSGKRSMAKKNTGTGIVSNEQDSDKCRTWNCRLKRIVARQNIPDSHDTSSCLSWDCMKRSADEKVPRGMTDSAQDTMNVPDIRSLFSDSRTRNYETQD